MNGRLVAARRGRIRAEAHPDCGKAASDSGPGTDGSAPGWDQGRCDHDEEDPVNRLLITARLREGVYEEAEALLRAGPPFDPEELGLHRHSAYLTATDVIFAFEAPEVEWIVNDVVD